MDRLQYGLHKQHSLLVPDGNWTTWTVTSFKADLSSSESLKSSANGAIRNTIGTIYICEISMGFHAIVAQFYPCEQIETKLFNFGIHDFQAQLID